MTMLSRFRPSLQKYVALLGVIVFLANAVTAQDQPAKSQEDSAGTPQTTGEAATDPPAEPLFTVPDGTAADLFAFISRVKRTPSKTRTRDAAMAHLKLQVEAVLAACDRIMAEKPDEGTEIKVINEKLGAFAAMARVDRKIADAGLKTLLQALEADERPAIVQLLAQRKLKERTAAVAGMSAAERASLIDELFAMVDRTGLDRETYTLISGVGRTLGRGADPEQGAVLYERLAVAMENSEDEALKSRAAKAVGSARRLRLPGKFMEITGKTATGEEFDWASYRGRVVLVDFWASWCGPCRAEIPNMKAQLEKYGEKGFAIVGVNLDTTMEKYQAYVDAEGLTWTNLMSDREDERGWDNPLATHYGITGIPTAILVDREGKVVSMSARGSTLNRLLLEHLGPFEEVEGEEAGAAPAGAGAEAR